MEAKPKLIFKFIEKNFKYFDAKFCFFQKKIWKTKIFILTLQRFNNDQ